MSFNVTQKTDITAVIAGDGWWCDLELAEFINLYRVPHEYSTELMADHLALARNWAVGQLTSWRIEQQGQGFTSLALVPLHGFAGEAMRTFKRAVFCHAKALLLPQFATIERREAAKNDAKESPETAAYFFAAAQHAITDLLGTTRIMVEAL